MRIGRLLNVMWMSPRKVLGWLVHGFVCLALVAGLYRFDGNIMVILLVSIIGLVPSVAVLVWGTVKFHTYYGVRGTRTDRWGMLQVTIIQLVAVAPFGFLITRLRVVEQVQFDETASWVSIRER